MRNIPRDDLLDVLACDIEARPPAPTVFHVAPLALNIARNPGALTVEFPADARAVVEEFAAAEQQCCAGIGWEVIDGPVVTLQITANDSALDVLEELLNNPNIESSQ